MTKSELRKIFLAKRRSLSPHDQAFLSGRIRDVFFENIDVSTVKFLHCYIPIPKFNEIDTKLIFARLWKDHPHIQTLVPRLTSGSGTMHNLRFGPDTAVVKNAWNIPEPVHDDHVRSSEIDMVLIPLLCFDRRGHRVGYGKGFYDRFLDDCRPDCQKIGLSYFPPVDVIDDIGGHDVTLDLCVTPEGIFTIGDPG